MKLHVIQAEFGDCLITETGGSTGRKVILIDGGPKGNYLGHLKSALTGILGTKKSIDLLVLSHIDNDHVLGLLEFLNDLKTLRSIKAKGVIRVRNLWHNSLFKIIQTPKSLQNRLEELTGLAILAPAEGTNPDDSRGFKEGDLLEVLAHAIAAPINHEGGGKPVTVEQFPKPVRLGKLQAQIIGPSLKNLAKLEKEWQAWFDKQAAGPAVTPRAAAAMSDDSTTNLSSIMFLLMENNHSILFTGDGRGDDILAGLEQVAMPKVDGRFHVDILKLPHHGSIRNIDGEFFKMLTADTYVVSANGRDGNPEYQTLEWIAAPALKENRKVRFVFTNKTDTTTQFEQKFAPDGDRLSVEYLPPDKDYLTIEI